MNTPQSSRLASCAALLLLGSALLLGQPADAANVPQLNRNLTVGATGEDVRSLQQYLNTNGYPIAASGAGSSGQETTMFGNATRAALARFQAASGLTASGYCGPQTRALLERLRAATPTTPADSAAPTDAALTTENASLKQRIASLEAQINALINRQNELQNQLTSALAKAAEAGKDEDEGEGPNITAIVVADNGAEGYIDTSDTIKITFDEALDPESLDEELEAGSYLTEVAYGSTGGVSISSAGKVTVRNIAAFDMGSVENSGAFTSKLALSNNARVLTITLTGGADIGITEEDFGKASQLGGFLEDEDGGEMRSDTDSVTPTGSFGGERDTDEDGSDGPRISAIAVADNGEKGYIDIGDTIKITFDEAIDPESVNADLERGDNVTGVASSSIGGVKVYASGQVALKGIAYFDMGSVSEEGTFTAKLALNSTGKVLTVTITGGSAITILDESFAKATQTGGYLENEDGDEMKSAASALTPTGSFGGVAS